MQLNYSLQKSLVSNDHDKLSHDWNDDDGGGSDGSTENITQRSNLYSHYYLSSLS